MVYLLSYIDDILIVSCDRCQIIKLKSHRSSKFEIKDFGCVKKILGTKIIRDREKGIFISQEGYYDKVLKKFNMVNAKPTTTLISSHFKFLALDSHLTKKEEK